jgi:hypothetical protein
VPQARQGRCLRGHNPMQGQSGRRAQSKRVCSCGAVSLGTQVSTPGARSNVPARPPCPTPRTPPVHLHSLLACVDAPLGQLPHSFYAHAATLGHARQEILGSQGARVRARMAAAGGPVSGGACRGEEASAQGDGSCTPEGARGLRRRPRACSTRAWSKAPSWCCRAANARQAPSGQLPRPTTPYPLFRTT